MGFLENFITEYFTNPLAHPDKYPPYNPVNTITFAILAIIAGYCILLLLRRLKVGVDAGFAISLFPYIVLGSVMRAVTDAGILPRSVQLLGMTAYPFVTPGIYIVVFFITVAALGISLLYRSRGGDFHKPMRAIGIGALAAFLLPFVPLFKHYQYAAEWLAITAVAFLVLEAASRIFKRRYSPMARFAALGQFVDGAATFTGIYSAGYWEQHVVGGALVGIHPAIFLLVKVAFGIVVAHLASGQKEGDETGFVLIMVGLFGFAPGIRDILRIVAGV